MASSLSNLVNNFSEGIHRIKCQFEHSDKKCEICGINYKYCDGFLEYTNFKVYILIMSRKRFRVNPHSIVA